MVEAESDVGKSFPRERFADEEGSEPVRTPAPIVTYSLEEVAAMLLPPEMTYGVKWLQERIRAGKASAYKAGRSWRMTHEDVEDLIRRQRNAVRAHVIPVREDEHSSREAASWDFGAFVAISPALPRWESEHEKAEELWWSCVPGTWSNFGNFRSWTRLLCSLRYDLRFFGLYLSCRCPPLPSPS